LFIVFEFMSRKLLLLFFVMPLLAQAQRLPETTKGWAVSFSPALVPFPHLSVALQPGVEYRFNKKYSLLTEFAFVPFALNHDSSHLGRQYLRIKPEFRFMLPRGTRDHKEYIAFQFSYAFRSFRNANGGFYYNSVKKQDITSYSTARINSPIFTGSFQFGSDFLIGRHLHAEIFAGAGIRNIRTSYSDVTNPQVGNAADPPRYVFLRIDPAYRFNQSIIQVHINGGARLLYRFE
jgi:hypothetical protein